MFGNTIYVEFSIQYVIHITQTVAIRLILKSILYRVNIHITNDRKIKKLKTDAHIHIIICEFGNNLFRLHFQIVLSLRICNILLLTYANMHIIHTKEDLYAKFFNHHNM